jgi:hypothetical protein
VSFKRYLEEQRQVNQHMEHGEDLVLNAGVQGARMAINYFQGVRDMLAGHSKRAMNITVKWDGAPAVFAGIDPTDGKFFVAKKGIFNKNPKVYKTAADVDADASGDLATKLKMALAHFKDLGIKGVVQGDLLYTDDTIERVEIDGVKYISFQPNTIVYTVPADSKLARQILRSKIGVVWHTTYTGDSFETMKASFGKEISSKLKKTTNVWHTDAMFRDASGAATFTADDTKNLTAILSRAGALFRTIPASALNDISDNDEFLIRVKAFNNSKVRAGETISNPAAHVTGLMNYIHAYYQKEADKKKTPAGKQSQLNKQKEMLRYFTKHSKQDIVKIFVLMNLLIEAKHYIVNKLNRVKTLGTFLRTSDGYRVTSPEGYVAIDHIGNAVKLVDRLEFSMANFSPDIIKGWQK